MNVSNLLSFLKNILCNDLFLCMNVLDCNVVRLISCSQFTNIRTIGIFFLHFSSTKLKIYSTCKCFLSLQHGFGVVFISSEFDKWEKKLYLTSIVFICLLFLSGTNIRRNRPINYQKERNIRTKTYL